MHPVDWAIVIAYVVYIVWDGLRRARGTDRMEGFLLANRSLPWWVVGLSVMATQLSAITLVGTTGQSATDGVRFIQFYLGLPLAMLILGVTIVPLLLRARVYTAYQYVRPVCRDGCGGRSELSHAQHLLSLAQRDRRGDGVGRRTTVRPRRRRAS